MRQQSKRSLSNVQMFNSSTGFVSDTCSKTAEDANNEKLAKRFQFTAGLSADSVSNFSLQNQVPVKPSPTTPGDVASQLTHIRGRQQADTHDRFLVPWVQGVTSVPTVEDRLLQGGTRQARKSCTPELSIDSFVPLVACMSDRIDKGMLHADRIASDATRDVDFQKRFLESSGYMNKGGVWSKKVCGTLLK